MPHTTFIYHCLHCGKCVERPEGAEAPRCCGAPMARAAECSGAPHEPSRRELSGRV